ncbi:HET domain-containing protein [Fusarium sp. LHS14.1]|nr:HET domain-containing protein [Fusarium sp. LHS14.1]
MLRYNGGSDLPKSESEAKKHIAKIRKARDKDKKSGIAGMMDNAIGILSDDLYQKPSHFILEFLQNADDGHYDTPEPTLAITLEDNTVRFDANEVGFTRTNVDALCSLGSSSKVQSDQATGHKGIGFKSVFKVADKVWIKSGHYSFKFDARERLGTVDPIWTKFPENEREGYTSIRLRLLPKLNLTALADELFKLDAQLLLFLRKIQCIEVQVIPEKGQRARPRRVLKRSTDSRIPDGLQRFTLMSDYSSTFLVSSHRTLKLGHDNRRKGRKHSDILLAFPEMSFRHPPTATQNIYSFLPIRNYGFKFIIQADFLLTASREDIDNSSDWNIKLLDELPEAMLTAIKRFNSRRLYDAWLPYLIFDHNQPGFFESLGEDILSFLSKQPILKSITGDLKPPSELTRIPLSLADTDGSSMIPRSFCPYTLVSSELSSKFTDALDGLEVKTLSSDEFLSEISYFISRFSTVFQSQPAYWHSRLASILLRLCGSPEFKTQIAELPIVLLQDGRWVTPNAGQLLLPLRSSVGLVPKGISGMEVHRDVADDPSRLRLIQEFGARESGLRMVCDIITKAHEDMTLAPQDVDTDELVSHIVFLYRAQWVRTSVSTKIWFVAEDGSRDRGHRMYVDSNSEFSAGAVFFGNHRAKFHFLHDKYDLAFSRIRSNENPTHWKKWIRENFGIAHLPRLASTISEDRQSFILSRDFKYLMDHQSSKIVLGVLKHNWSHYSRWIQDAPTDATEKDKKRSKEKLRFEFSSWRVQCRGGPYVHFPLRKTCLPRKNVLVGLGLWGHASGMQGHAQGYPLLEISDPEDSGWDFLQHFDVVTELKPVHFINRLMDLRRSDTTRAAVSVLYDQIVACAEDSQIGTIRKAFEEYNLIFIPPTDHCSNRWVGLDECTWEGFTCLRKIPDLKRHYPSHQHETLFRKYLNIPVANLKTLVSEVQQVTSSDSLSYLRDLFVTTSRRMDAATLSEYNDAAIVKQLGGRKIWPIAKSGSGDGFETLMANDDVWYIPDHGHLRETFSGKLPFLAFDTATLAQLEQLLRPFGLDRRIISKAATSKTSTMGEAPCMVEYTKALTTKAEFIARLVPMGHADRSTILRRLGAICVYQPQKVSVQWTVVTQVADIVHGHEESGRVSVMTKEDGLDIYLVPEDSNIYCPPLELTEELAACCGITNPEHVQLLTHILVQQDIQRISSDLERKGIPNDLEGFDNTNAKLPESVSADVKISSSFDDPLDTMSSLAQTLTGSYMERTPSPSSYVARTAEWDEVQKRYRLVTVGPKTRSIKYGVTALSVPESFASGSHSEKEDNFIGQLYVSSFLREVVGEEYKPRVHWTSPLRNMAGHSPFQNDAPDTSTFTVQDTEGQFKKFLEQQGFQGIESLADSVTFHIETIVSVESLHSGFTLNAHQAKKAEILSLTRHAKLPLAEAFILAVVCNLHDEPRIAFFDDPWRHYHGGSLSLEAPSGYWARFNESARPLHVRGAANVQIVSSEDSGCYKYRDLRPGEMRLFKLSPGTDDEPLKGSVHHVLADSDEEYQALSYVWGDINCSLAPHFIETPEGGLQISFSLHSALRAIRGQKADTMLWIDAICINQGSVTEKAIQIRLLSTIFQSATQVVAWLGPENQSQNGDIVIENLKSITHFARQSESTYWCTFLDSIKTKNQSRGGNIDALADLDAFLARPWFKRAWIVQELVLPSKVTLVCGRSTIDWDEFFEAIQLCERGLNSGGHQPDDILVLQHASPAYALGMARKSLKEGRNKFALLRLLDMFAHCQATKLVDKLFALLGLGSDCSQQEFNPDYDSTVQQVVQRYATCFVQRGQVMDLLCRAGRNKAYGFCSWIPEWTRHSFPQTISTWDAAKGTFYAGKREHPTADVQATSDSSLSVLQVGGISVDKITSVATIREIGKDGADYPGTADDFRNLIEFIHSYPSGESKEDILLKLPIGDARKPHLESTTDRLRAYRDFVSQETHEWPSDLEQLVWGDKKRSPEEDRVVKQYWQTSQAFMNRISKAIFCRTEKGYAGLVPGGSQQGDEICTFGGGKAPFVLRKHIGAEYTLLGECYMHGLMYGTENIQGAEEREFCVV